MKRIYLIFAVVLLSAWFSDTALAIPTQYGDSGLLSQPTAETLNAGNICIGVWTNHASADPDSATIVPVSMTLGLGAFLEAYGSYPNLLFNDEDRITSYNVCYTKLLRQEFRDHTQTGENEHIHRRM